MTEQPSGRLYSAITKYWPRIAAGLVGLTVVTEWVIGGLTSDSGLEFYIFAWATTTGGFWFLFEKAENALSEESREKVVGWLGATDSKGSIDSIPEQFALLFDRVFGERHLSWRCFWRSCVASVVAIFIAYQVVLGLGMPISPASGIPLPFTLPRPEGPISATAYFLVYLGLFGSTLPDYVSLLETRWAMSWMRRKGCLGLILTIDVLLTAAISLTALWVILGTMGTWFSPVRLFSVVMDINNLTPEAAGVAGVWRVYLLSAFFTSFWLWLYAASVFLSRLLLRMNNGVGFLLRVTDVERQPFRSMGFVSVIITSVLFALGLPLVLL